MRQELYEECGITVKTLGRTISKLKEDGVISLKKGKSPWRWSSIIWRRIRFITMLIIKACWKNISHYVLHYFFRLRKTLHTQSLSYIFFRGLTLDTKICQFQMHYFRKSWHILSGIAHVTASIWKKLCFHRSDIFFFRRRILQNLQRAAQISDITLHKIGIISPAYQLQMSDSSIGKLF